MLWASQTKVCPNWDSRVWILFCTQDLTIVYAPSQEATCFRIHTMHATGLACGGRAWAIQSVGLSSFEAATLSCVSCSHHERWRYCFRQNTGVFPNGIDPGHSLHAAFPSSRVSLSLAAPFGIHTPNRFGRSALECSNLLIPKPRFPSCWFLRSAHYVTRHNSTQQRGRPGRLKASCVFRHIGVERKVWVERRKICTQKHEGRD